MVIHYLKVAVRNLLKYKTQTIIGIMSLAIGLTCFIFSIHWLKYETSYDSFYPNSERCYLVYTVAENNKTGESPNALADFILMHLPEVETVTHSYEGGRGNMDYRFGENLIKNPYFMSVDSSFVQVFPQTILYGRTLQQADEIIISHSFARKHFGEPHQAIGKILSQTAPRGFILQDARQLHIVGIMSDAPSNSTMTPSGYYQQSYLRKTDVSNPREWQNNIGYTHLLLKEGVKQDDFTNRLHASLKQYDFLKEKSFKVIPLHQKHFEFTSEESFSYSAISMFTLATGLLLCCILFNFCNLFLNRYYQRIREVKLRKSVGANTLKLLAQVVTEIMAYTILGNLLCGCLIELGIPFFEETFGITISKPVIWKEYLWMSIVVLLVILGLLLPLVWHFIRSVGHRSLIGKPQAGNRNRVRRIALSIQLAICIFFLASGASLYRQISYMEHSDLGYNTEHIIELVILGFEQNGQDMLEDIKKLPMIECYVNASQYMVSKTGMHVNGEVEWKNKREEDKNIKLAKLELSSNGDKMFGFRLKEGHTYREEDWVGSNEIKDATSGIPVLNRVLVNESAVKTMRLANPIGEIIRIPFQILGKDPIYTDYEIIGVIQDFHSQGMKASPQPTIIFPSFRFRYPLHYFQITPGTEVQAFEAIYNLAEKHGWEFGGMNEPPQLLVTKMKNLNKSELAIFRLFSILTCLCVLISLFGIFSVSASTIYQRRKEIAVRKIMGAKVKDIKQMFFHEYGWLVGVSAILAFPLFYYVVSQWLEQFVYRVEISITLYVALSVLTTVLVLLTVFKQIQKVSNENPAEVIKSE